MRKRLLASLSVAASLTLAAVTTTPAHAFVPPGEKFRMVLKHSHKCLDIENASTSNGARLVQRKCEWNRPSQIFTAMDGPSEIPASTNRIKTFAGLCLSRDDESYDSGGQALRQRECEGSGAVARTFSPFFYDEDWQPTFLMGTWDFDAGRRYVPSGKCWDVPDSFREDGVVLQTWKCTPKTDNKRIYIYDQYTVVLPKP
ncbi:RICIN domain-containing protein [Streptomyces tsukubensis]|uniref:RICIN domain-containing protein n=1 Tax=Streptomyces tsukubensis TaxID=83656 RepID=UPI00344D531F